MSDMLSQEEIDSLLGGKEGNDSSDSTPQEPDKDLLGAEFATQESNDVMPEEAEDAGKSGKKDIEAHEPNQDALTDLEKDTLGEVGNISMGAAATALHNLIGKKVDITIPTVSVTNYSTLAKKYDIPYVAIHISYVEGLHGDNMLIMKIEDVKAITSILIGSDEYNEGELSELHLSAISECMNQMMGASATSLSKLVNMKINISPPTVEIMNLADALVTDLIDQGDSDMVSTSFNMEVEDLFTTEIMLLMDLQFGKDIVNGFFETQEAAQPELVGAGTNTAEPSHEASMLPPEMDPTYATPPGYGAQQTPPPGYGAPQTPPPGYGAPQMPPPGYGYPQMQMPPPGYGYQPQPQPQPAYNVQSIQYENFGGSPGVEVGENIEMLMDVPLQVTVELGRTKKNLKEILDFNVGSIITLDKLVGEAVDVVVNGKMIAKGEVVVADDNFAVRITEIMKINRVAKL
ncbi:MAG: flagellar motor switch phosphatase FliY [Oscillospiraceae bacterium]|nr:flagellar motor switch phosphatase FliY [Oscillospiraceae bacterium]